MKRSKVLFISMIIMLMTSCSDNKNAASPAVAVEAKKVHPHTISYSLNYPAMVQGVVDYPVIPRVSGVIYKKYYKEGTYVKKGQPLYQIDPRPFEFQLKGFEGQLIKDKAARDNYKLIYERYRDLYAYKAVSTQDVENARIQYEAAVGNVKTDEANIDEARLNLKYCLVRSPANGFIGERVVTVGVMATAFQTVLNNINSANQMYILFSMPENQRLELEDGTLNHTLSVPKKDAFKMDVRLANGKMIKNAGHVEFIDTRIALDNGSWNMRGFVDNRDFSNKLLSGQYVTVFIRGIKYLNTFNVPQEAVMSSDTGSFVYVIQQKDNKSLAFKRFVKTGKMYDEGQWMIVEGLKDGDIVVTKGNLHLNENTVVKIDHMKED